jgi:tetratricopeptide (TPR) repeat protein
VLGNLGRTEDGIRAWERALELNPNNAGARAGLGIAQIYAKKPEQALENIDTALRLSPRDPLIYHWLGSRALACAVLGRWEEAIESSRESVERTASRLGYAVLAAACAQVGRVDEAHQSWVELERRIPDLDVEVFGRLAETVALDEEGGRRIADALRRAAAG